MEFLIQFDVMCVHYTFFGINLALAYLPSYTIIYAEPHSEQEHYCADV